MSAEFPRIYEMPNHRCYGPVRRLHVMLLQVYADVGMDGLDAVYSDDWLAPWDHDLAWFLDHETTESVALRTIIGRCFKSFNP